MRYGDPDVGAASELVDGCKARLCNLNARHHYVGHTLEQRAAKRREGGGAENPFEYARNEMDPESARSLDADPFEAPIAYDEHGDSVLRDMRDCIRHRINEEELAILDAYDAVGARAFLELDRAVARNAARRTWGERMSHPLPLPLDHEHD
jgi:hypothetical protein